MNMPEAACIRPMEAGDLECVRAWRNHPQVRGCMLTQHAITADEHRAWFDRTSKDPRRRLLVVEAGGQPVGFVQFSDVERDRTAQWGFYAAPEAPKGTGRTLGRLALDHAFGALGLHKVCGQALDTNEASINFHRMLGFRQEGILREQHCIGTTYHDLICFGLLRSEWPGTDAPGEP